MATPAVDAAFVDVAFTVRGTTLERDHRRALAAALQQALPWLAEVAGAAVHRLNVAAGGDALLSQRTRLTLRLPPDRVTAAQALCGQTLGVGPHALQVGEAQVRALRPHGTLYAHLVAGHGDDENRFLRGVQDELDALAVRGRAICGRHQFAENGLLQGHSLMLDGLSAAHALRVMEAGLGPHRLWGCGVFVPHRSAAAVGAPS